MATLGCSPCVSLGELWLGCSRRIRPASVLRPSCIRRVLSEQSSGTRTRRVTSGQHDPLPAQHPSKSGGSELARPRPQISQQASGLQRAGPTSLITRLMESRKPSHPESGSLMVPPPHPHPPGPVLSCHTIRANESARRLRISQSGCIIWPPQVQPWSISIGANFSQIGLIFFK